MTRSAFSTDFVWWHCETCDSKTHATYIPRNVWHTTDLLDGKCCSGNFKVLKI